MHNKAPIIGAASDDAYQTGQERITTTAKWANMWRSITLSCLGSTLFRYAQHIRKLDFQDLEQLLDDATFWSKISEYANNLQLSHRRANSEFSQFFAGSVGNFKVVKAVKAAKGTSKMSSVRLDVSATANNIAKRKIQSLIICKRSLMILESLHIILLC